jgi:hypothetical protein
MPSELAPDSSSVKNSEAIDLESETAALKSLIFPESGALNGDSLQIGFVILCVGGESMRRRHEATGAS